MKIKKMLILPLICGISIQPMGILGQQRGGAAVKVKNEQTNKTEDVRLYKASYALVVGVSDYTNGWQRLPGVADDVKAVGTELERQGFHIVTVLNPNRLKLRQSIEDFIESYGYEADNRLLIYYAGHGDTGKTADGRNLGYIIPADAPLRIKDEWGFRRTAISMDEIESYAKRIEAKHALFVFDSCFSGSLLTARRSGVPPAITYKITQPVRQFITAGTEDQEVPDNSVFREQFIAALQGEADQNRDGYVTVSELADFLQTKVTNYTHGSQTPQYGKIFDGRLDKGDFVFILPKKTAIVVDHLPSLPETNITARDAAAIELEAWNFTRISTNAADYRAFIEEFPNGRYAAQARIKLEQVVWDSVKNSTDKAVIQKYLTEFPAGPNASLARLRLRQIESASAVVPKPSPIGNNSGGSMSNNSGLLSVARAGAIEKARLPNNAEMSFAYIPAGSFETRSINGVADEKRINRVIPIKGFWMGQTEVTQAQWKAIMGENPSAFKQCGDNCPVEYVSWEDAQEFLRQLNLMNDGYKYRLPTGSEWEYAARAGTAGDYVGEFDSMAWYRENSGNKTHPVRQKQANGWNLYDMHGNVDEWVQYWYESFPIGEVKNQADASSDSWRYACGGHYRTLAPAFHSCYRITGSKIRVQSAETGFRVVRVAL